MKCDAKVFEEFIKINNRYQLYQDGVIYDNDKGEDIPLWIFEFRDFILRNYETMKQQVGK